MKIIRVFEAMAIMILLMFAAITLIIAQHETLAILLVSVSPRLAYLALEHGAKQEVKRAHPTPTYFKCHVTLDPVEHGSSRRALLENICVQHKFNLANLWLSHTERSNKDAFCTSRDSSYDEMKYRMIVFMHALSMHGFYVRREKIEAVVYDHRFAPSSPRS
jgi:hypothetical protein